MAKYEKKMMQFDAFQYNGELSISECDWAAMAVLKGILFFEDTEEKSKMELYTRHPDGEVVHIPVGYYVIRWSDTELYPCESNLFEASYIPVGEENEERRNLRIQDGDKLREEKKRELEAAVKPLHEWLCKYGDPYTTVVVLQDGATVHQEFMATTLPVPD